ncbi:MAG: bifunctional aldolase/short-chain dehydrogenase [Candidatus Binatia bacterium]|nr:bifunctional aldolase/short-chain dehydrogenase [Candidatus Binatia bacterium]
MQSRWSDTEAQEYRDRYAQWGEPLALRVYTSRLIGQDPDLVMHGGGNTSVKIVKETVLGEKVDALCVKGSGWDLDSIEPPGLPALALEPLRALRSLPGLSDEEMVNQQRIRLFDSKSPNPSVETLLHAFLPHTFIDHTHADAILALTNQPGGADLVLEALGDKLVLVPYVMPGFDLAKLAAEMFEKQPEAEGMVLLKHGLFTFAGDARTSYERTIEVVDRAEKFLALKAKPISVGSSVASAQEAQARASRVAPILRGLLATATPGANQPYRRMVLDYRVSNDLLALLAEPTAAALAERGPLTPDHVIRTKATPVFVPDLNLSGDDDSIRDQLRAAIDAFRARYDAYFDAQVAAKKIERTKLDADPRVVLLPGIGVFCSGKSAKDARIAGDLTEHTLRIKSQAERTGSYEALDDGHLFDMEYWSLEQAKLGKAVEKSLSRQVALVTGAAGAIGIGVCLELAREGAHVVLADIDEAGLEKAHARVAEIAGSAGCSTVKMDVTDPASVEAAFDQASRQFGGVDIVVPNAGIAHVGSLVDTDPKRFDKVIDVNLGGYFHTMQSGARVLRAQGTGGNIIVQASKNVFGPGADFGAYSASKAAGHQLGKVAAIELAPAGIRVNMINADAVFSEGETRSGLWNEIGADRAASKGIEADELQEHYRKRNLLHAIISGAHVGRAVVFFASNQTPTTGATLPVDGGVAAAFPR